MTKKKMLMVSLEDDDSKDIAQVITNKSCRKILDYLSQNDKATEGKIAKDLKLPLSTTNYSIKQLINAELIEGNEYNYSRKGKKVFHYKLANQFIIIAPKKVTKSDIRKQLKEMLGLFGLSVLGAFGVFSLSRFFENMKFRALSLSTKATVDNLPMMASNVVEKSTPIVSSTPIVARTMTEGAVIQTTDAVVKNADVAQKSFDSVQECIAQQVPRNLSAENAAIWFLTGAIFIIVIYLLYILLSKRKGSKK